MTIVTVGIQCTATAASAQRAYVANHQADSVFVIDTETGSVVGEVQFPFVNACPFQGVPRRVEPVHLAVTPDGLAVYVTSNLLCSLYVIDTRINRLQQIIGIRQPVTNLAISPDGSEVYVTGDWELTVVETATNAVTGHIPLTGGRAVAFHPTEPLAYVARIPVAAVNTRTREVIGFPFEPGSTPTDVAVGPLGHELLVYSFKDFMGELTGAFSIVDPSIPQILGEIGFERSSARIAVSPVANHAYVAHAASGKLFVVDLGERRVAGEVAVPGGELAIDPAGIAWVTVPLSDQVWVVDLASASVVSTLKLPRCVPRCAPAGIALHCPPNGCGVPPTITPTPSATPTETPTPSVSATPEVTSTATATPPVPSPSATPRVTVSACAGDCDADGHVTIIELVRGVALSLGRAVGGACDALDQDGSGSITINELVLAVRAALEACRSPG